jgi:uncharacterized protein (TIGR01244 family)
MIAMTEFTPIDDTVFVAGQILPEDVTRAAGLGIALIINNRPDFEEEDQPEAALIEAATRAAGLDYVAIPVGPEGMDANHFGAMAQALAQAEGPVLAFCRSGTRSSMLWALSQAFVGRDADTLAAQVRAAGYNPVMIEPTLRALAARAA